MIYIFTFLCFTVTVSVICPLFKMNPNSSFPVTHNRIIADLPHANSVRWLSRVSQHVSSSKMNVTLWGQAATGQSWHLFQAPRQGQVISNQLPITNHWPEGKRVRETPQMTLMCVCLFPSNSKSHHHLTFSCKTHFSSKKKIQYWIKPCDSICLNMDGKKNSKR